MNNNTVEFSSKMTVRLVNSMASDIYVADSARVSAGNTGSYSRASNVGLINSLMKHRHGSPFEHSVFTFHVEAPIFVVREWQRHRVSSFNEMSGRYTELKPKFYIPDENRKMINYGTKMEPKFSYDRNGAGKIFRQDLMAISETAWCYYQNALEQGVANEVARMLLPLNTFTQFYWTVNSRSLMNFLSLRVESDDSTYRSYPQIEIQQCAEQVEEIFRRAMPTTHKAFVDNGRVAP